MQLVDKFTFPKDHPRAGTVMDMPAPNSLEHDAAAVPIDPRLRGKRVAMVTFSPYPRDPRPRRAVDALLQQGMLVDLLCVTEEGNPEHESSGGLQIRRLPIQNRRGGKFSYIYQYGLFIFITAAILAWRSMQRPYDLEYVHNMPDILVLSALVPKLLGAKVILDLHDPMPELMRTIFKLERNSASVHFIGALEKWSMARADRVLTVNIACKRIFGSRSCPPDKIAVVMNSPDSTIFPFREPRSYASVTNNRHNSLTIMYHGSLLERNGLDLAVDALAIVRKTIPNVELQIYGAANPFFERVMASAAEKGLDGCIRYRGLNSLEQIAAAVAECDIGIVPNHRNTFTEINTPTRIFEYLALGKPVIAPSTPGILDYFTEDSLLLFEPGNSTDIARQIEYAALNYTLAVQTAERGQQVYLQHTWKQERNRLIGVVSSLFSEETFDADPANDLQRTQFSGR